jgi:protein-tyrosine phosphatase
MGNEVTKIMDHLFISSRLLIDEERFSEHDISCVVILNGIVLDNERFPNIKAFYFELEDSMFGEGETSTLFKHEYDIYDLVKDIHEEIVQEHNVCIVCDYGLKRSPVVATAYLIISEGKDLDTAVKTVCECRGKDTDIVPWYYRELELLRKK